MNRYLNFTTLVNSDATPDNYRQHLAEIDTTPNLKTFARQCSELLSDLLNSSAIKHLAFGSRRLWLLIAGNYNYGQILQRIVFAHQVSYDGDIKLDTWYGDRYYYWHTAKQFAEELYISEQTVRRGIKRLVELSLISYRVWKNDFGITCYHIALNYENFFKELMRFCKQIDYKVINRELSKRSIPSNSKNKYKKETNIEAEQKNSEFGIRSSELTTQVERFAEPRMESGQTGKETHTNPEFRIAAAGKNALLTSELEEPQVQPIAPEKRPPIPRVDFLVNFKSYKLANKLTASFTEAIAEVCNVAAEYLPIPKEVKKQMARWNRQGDEFFGNSRQDSIRARARSQSTLGMSRFKTADELNDCRHQIALYFANQMTGEAADNRAKWAIEDERKGTRSPFVTDYLEGKKIGTWCMEEWEVEPGIPNPAITAYLRHKLCRHEDTHAQTVQKSSWELKDYQKMVVHWNECKRLIVIEKPRLMDAIAKGINPLSTNIPRWVIEAFRPEVPLEDALDAMKLLGEVAIKQNEIIKYNQEKLFQEQLEHSRPNTPVTISGGVTEKKMNQIAQTKNIFGVMPEPESEADLTTEQKIDRLLSEDATRPEGVRQAIAHKLPMVHDRYGMATGIDFVALDERNKPDYDEQVEYKQKTTPTPEPTQPRYAAHEIYEPSWKTYHDDSDEANEIGHKKIPPEWFAEAKERIKQVANSQEWRN